MSRATGIRRNNSLGKKDAVSGEVAKSPEIHDAREFGNIFLLKGITEQIGHTQVFRERFFRKWAERFAAVNRFIVFDITSISSYAEGIDCIEWGYNRDRESLPQVNLGIVYGEPSGMPLYYSVYPGSIHDVTTLRITITELELLSLNKTLFILDKGFYVAGRICGTWTE